MQKNSALSFLRIAVTAALLTYVLHQAGLLSIEGWQNLIDRFTQIKPLFIWALVGLGVLLTFSSALKWYMLARSRGLPVSFWRLYAYYLIGMFFNLILPTGMGGDVVRMHQLGRYTERYADAAASVFVERFSGMVTLFVLALLAVVVNLRLFNLPWLTVGISLAVVSAALICWSIVDERPFKLAQQLFGKRMPLFRKLLAKMEKFRQAVLAYPPGPLWVALINSLIFHFLAVVNAWVSVLAFGSDLSFLNMLVAVPIILFIMNLPVSIGGIGLMEFAYSFTLGLFGATPTLAISAALLIRAKSFLFAGIGGLFYILVGNGRPISKGSAG